METDKKKTLLNLLVKAAELVEEVYARQPELIHDDHAQDYADMVSALHANNVFFRANPKITQMAHDYNPLKAIGKMPMEKAKGKEPKEDQKKNVG